MCTYELLIFLIIAAINAKNAGRIVTNGGDVNVKTPYEVCNNISRVK